MNLACSRWQGFSFRKRLMMSLSRNHRRLLSNPSTWCEHLLPTLLVPSISTVAVIVIFRHPTRLRFSSCIKILVGMYPYLPILTSFRSRYPPTVSHVCPHATNFRGLLLVKPSCFLSNLDQDLKWSARASPRAAAAKPTANANLSVPARWADWSL